MHRALSALPALLALTLVPAGPAAAQGGPVHRFRLLAGPPDTPPRECPAAGTVAALPDPPPLVRGGEGAGPAAAVRALAQAVRLVEPELLAESDLPLELGVEKDLLAPDHCGGKPGVRVTLTALTHEVAAYRVRFVAPDGALEAEGEARVLAGERAAVYGGGGPGRPNHCRVLVVELVRGAQLNPVEPPPPPLGPR